MGAGTKYLFETDFGNPQTGQLKAQRYTEDDLLAAKAEALRQARADMGTLEEKRAADLIATIAARLDDLTAQRAADAEEATAAAAALAMAICRKMLPVLAAKHALTEITGHITRTLAELQGEPRVVVRTAEANVAALRPRVDALAAGFDGKLVLLPDDEMAPTDCHVMWADGGSERDVARLWRSIDQAVAQITSIEADAATAAPERLADPVADAEPEHISSVFNQLDEFPDVQGEDES